MQFYFSVLFSAIDSSQSRNASSVIQYASFEQISGAKVLQFYFMYYFCLGLPLCREALDSYSVIFSIRHKRPRLEYSGLKAKPLPSTEGFWLRWLDPWAFKTGL